MFEKTHVESVESGTRRAREAKPVFVLFAVALAGLVAAGDVGAEPAEQKVYVVACSHLDTQWWWTIDKTIRECIPATFTRNFALLDKFAGYNFSWEGTFRYGLLREYYPELWEKLKGYVESGRWSPAGSSLEAGDVNVPSPESLVRQYLYGSTFFRQEFGRSSIDVFLPDCFGFGWALPSIAAHCGLSGFSTQKLGWGSMVDLPFDIGLWEGVDGNRIVAALDPGSYIDGINHDLSSDHGYVAQCSTDFEGGKKRVGFRYFGVGDQGGAPDEASVEWLQKSIDSDGPVEVLSARSDQLFRDLTAEQVAELPVYKGELLLTTHGTGSYTSQAAMKRYNRKNELLGDAAERASVVADWLGAAPYPAEKLSDAWRRFLVHQSHDTLTGTGIPQVYFYAWNDEILAHNRFSSALVEAVGGVAKSLDTTAEGLPLIVFNPLAFERQDVVEATVRFPASLPASVVVFGPDLTPVPSQVVGQGEGSLDILFLATVPAVGFAVYDVRPAEAGAERGEALSASAQKLANDRYEVGIRASGDVESVLDKKLGKELLAGPIRLALFDDFSALWPGWEILWEDVARGPREFVAGPAEVEVVEGGPVRVAVEVTRKLGGSVFVQTVRLSAGEAGERVEIELAIDWWTEASFLKALFPLASANPKATYDLGLGTIARGNNTSRSYEVPAQQWVDLPSPDGTYGIAVLNDCKYGWDKPEDGTLRLTLLHTPFTFFNSVYYGHNTQDMGPHKVLLGLYGHDGDWRAGTVRQAARLNQPLRAFQTLPGEGALGRRLSFLTLADEGIEVQAMKMAEQGDEIVVRVREAAGKARAGIRLGLGTGVAAARELDGTELEKGAAAVDDAALVFDVGAYGIRTFGLSLNPPATSSAPAKSRPVAIPYDTDVATSDADRGDGTFGLDEGISYSLPAEQLPAELVNDGIRFVLGPTGAGQANALTCKGQEIPLEPLPGDRLYVLAAATEDCEAAFTVGDAAAILRLQDFARPIGQWTDRLWAGKVIEKPADFKPPFLKQADVAWYSTHRHSTGGDDPYRFTYIFQYVLPVPAGAVSLRLPDDGRVRVFAVTLGGNPGHGTTAACELYDGFAPLLEPLVPAMGEAEELPTAEGNPEPEVPPAGGGGGCAAETGHPSGCVALLLLLWASRRALRRGTRRLRLDPGRRQV